jgi:hypothetical protein
MPPVTCPRLGAALAAAEEAWIAAGFPTDAPAVAANRGRRNGRNAVMVPWDSPREPLRPTLQGEAAMSTNRRPADIARRSANALRARPRDTFRCEIRVAARESAGEGAT